MLLERPWSTVSVGGASLREASSNLHVEVVTALLHKLERVSVESFESALSDAVQLGSMKLFKALVTNVASSDMVFRRCMSQAAALACQLGRVRTGCTR